MINVRFTDRVGVSPGTTTMAFNGGAGPDMRCLGDSDEPCLPDPRSPYMTHSGTAAIVPQGGGAAAADASTAPAPMMIPSVPYGTESTLRGRGVVNLLGATPLGLSWPGFLALVGGAMVVGVGLAVLARRS